MKWTKEMNIDIIRCYFNTILRIPNQPYRKEFYNRWVTLYPENRLTEQRICDQQRLIMRKATTNENTRGSWLTEMEITDVQATIANEIGGEINNEPVGQQAEVPNHQYQAEEHQQQHQIAEEKQHVPGQEINADQQLIEELLSQYAKATVTPFSDRIIFKKPGRKSEFKLKKAIEKINKSIEVTTLQTIITDVRSLDDFVYATAVTAIKKADVEKECITNNKQQQNEKNNWKVNLQIRINDLRADISKINQMTALHQSPKMKKNANAMKNKYNINSEDVRLETEEKLKQRLSALNNRFQRFVKREDQHIQNYQFESHPNKFYDTIRGNKIEVIDTPSEEEVSNFWRPMYENEKHFNKDASWIPEYKESISHVQQPAYEPVTANEVTKATSNFQNWKSSGIDHLQNFWWCHLTCIHEITATILDNIIQNPEECPLWLTQGRTTLIPKSDETRNPSNYRPITCLPIIYKILNSIITSRMRHHIDSNSLIPPQQKGCTSTTYGTIDQLSINKTIMEEAVKNSRNISTAWIDYKKAYDSIPHDWLIETLKIHQFDEKIVNFFKTTINNWKTSLHLTTNEGDVKTGIFNIMAGIFQGDCPSGIQFVLCLLPLTWMLKKSKLGYKPRNQAEKISHLMFMDDIKLYGANDHQLESLVNIVKRFSDDIQMNFGIKKCNKITIVRGKVKTTTNIVLENGEEIKSLNNQEFYKYLGFSERDTTTSDTKMKLKTEYYLRLKKILKSELNSKNTINAINAYATPSLTYGFQVIDWSITELEEIDRTTRTTLQKHHMMNNKSDITRLYLPRSKGGRGLVNITNQYKNSIIKFSIYIQNTDEQLLQYVSNQQLNRGQKSIHHKANKYCEELNLDLNETATKPQHQTKQILKASRIQQQEKELREKATHGQFLRTLEQQHIDKEASNPVSYTHLTLPTILLV